jgi:hypothetical protein
MVRPMAHPYGLTDAEYDALVALQNGRPGPPETSAAWTALLKMKLVWRDPLEGGLRLTAAGQRYPDWPRKGCPGR